MLKKITGKDPYQEWSAGESEFNDSVKAGCISEVSQFIIPYMDYSGQKRFFPRVQLQYLKKQPLGA